MQMVLLLHYKQVELHSRHSVEFKYVPGIHVDRQVPKLVLLFRYSKVLLLLPLQLLQLVASVSQLRHIESQVAQSVLLT